MVTMRLCFIVFRNINRLPFSLSDVSSNVSPETITTSSQVKHVDALLVVKIPVSLGLKVVGNILR